MIPYSELCDAIDRWRARESGEPVDAAAPAPAPAPAYEPPAEEPPPVEAAPEGSMPEAIAPEHTNEIDIDSVDVVEG